MARRSLLLAELADAHPAPPELDDADYVREVLARPDGATEADIEQELALRAAALGIELPAPGGGGTGGGSNTDDQGTSPAGDSSDGRHSSQRTRAVSAASDGSTDTSTTPLTDSSSRRQPRNRRSLSFSQYERYISQVDPALDQSKLLGPRHEKAGWSASIVAKSGGKKSGGGGGGGGGVRGFTRSIAAKLRRRRPSPNLPMPCICCREDFPALDNGGMLHTLPCGHCYCRECLCIMVEQSIVDESKMPPRCCTQPIPSAIVKLVLPREKQPLFLKSVLQYSTPWDARIFCPRSSCGEFIPPADRGAADPKHRSGNNNTNNNPFEAVCRNCGARVCVMCKRAAHPAGQDCPEDRESEAVLRMGERSGWRRCYKCRSLVELAQGCTHMTCRCKAQFCYICGAVWDPAVGCPNFCNGEEELERRRVEEEARLAELEAEKLALEKVRVEEEAARLEAERRTAESSEVKALRAQQEAEMVRFLAFEHKAKAGMRAREADRKKALSDKFADLMDRMRDRHAKTEQHLEDRQVMAELELQAGLEEKEKKVRIQLKYMEDYCNGGSSSSSTAPSASSSTTPSPSTTTPPPDPSDTPSPNPTTTTPPNLPTEAMPQRQVTERHLEQLRQQYCLRDGMQKRHASQIHGLRERQAKSMEELVERHEREMDALLDRRATETEALAERFADEEEVMVGAFQRRRGKLESRWGWEGRVLKGELERRGGKRFAEVGVPKWLERGFERGEVDEVEGAVVVAWEA
ncbi:hypothetical protein C8A05DRAFT_35301 [Staphylotrichum tortipilum]|uniref:RBR-type E3 ubiquitin transferase n=1 Tax=Staphylotrichum tortipilum TaxID=2831512 RepID=A0AAN6RSN4_9PEZI|nr:hypothetical protein C8A05DRAFT_35301 [Staphylotrichum longicolle]